MPYLSEIVRAWRPLLAAMLGLATGNSVLGIITSAIAPTLLADTGWSRSEFALVGSLSLFGSLVLPTIGRMADTLGVRLTALVGLVCLPVVYFAYSLTAESLKLYMAVFFVQATVCVTTTSMVYTRLVVQHVQKARGLALAIVASSPALAGAIGGPILNAYVEAHGWQESYRALSLLMICTGVLTFLMIPPDRTREQRAGPMLPRARGTYRQILAMPAFWIIAGSMLLCNLPQTLLLTQLKLLVIDQGITGKGAAVMLSTVSIGMLTGRIGTGLALDRFKPHAVAFLAMGLPGIGLFVIASPWDSYAVVLCAVFFLGFAYGAEGDAIAFLVARHFGLEIYSSVMGLTTAVISFSTALGAGILSLTLDKEGDFAPFLYGTGLAVVIGSLILLRLGACPVALPRSRERSPAPAR